jgi:pimeloyl-ACP methyl ester carboxylesterase
MAWQRFACNPRVCGLVLLIATMAGPAAAQAPAPAGAEGVTGPPADFVVETSDGVRITATYYPGSKGKDSVPVILLHDYQGSRQDMAPLAEVLQKNFGYAVVAPDLRGHGQSTTTRDPNKKLNASSGAFLDEFPLMATKDVEKMKSFLMAKNNAAELNIDKLSLVGAGGMGSVVAALFAARDWSYPVLATGKQGQDVKTIAMISPDFVFKNLSMNQAFGEPVGGKALQKEISIYVVVGTADTLAASEANRVYKAFNLQRKKPADPKDATAFFDETLKTKLQGVKLFTEPSLRVSERIGAFIEFRAGSQPYPWMERRNPLGGG